MIAALCPKDDTPLKQWPDGIIECPTCHVEYVVSISAARPVWHINPAAPFAQLVRDADAALYGPRTKPFTRKAA